MLRRHDNNGRDLRLSRIYQQTHPQLEVRPSLELADIHGSLRYDFECRGAII